MSKSTRTASWLYLVLGLLYLLGTAHDMWVPHFLSFKRHHPVDPWLGFATAAFCLFAACRGFMLMRRHSAR